MLTDDDHLLDARRLQQAVARRECPWPTGFCRVLEAFKWVWVGKGVAQGALCINQKED